MLIGLPNKVGDPFRLFENDTDLTQKDGSFTLTLFAPFASLATIQSRDEARQFFNDNFPTAVAIAGEKRLLDDFENNPRGNLVTINVSLVVTELRTRLTIRPIPLHGLHTRSCWATRRTVWFRESILCVQGFAADFQVLWSRSELRA